MTTGNSSSEEKSSQGASYLYVDACFTEEVALMVERNRLSGKISALARSLRLVGDIMARSYESGKLVGGWCELPVRISNQK